MIKKMIEMIEEKERIARVKEDFLGGILPYDRAIDEIRDIYTDTIYQQLELFKKQYSNFIDENIDG